MTDRTEQLRAFYEEHRVADQVGFYASRRSIYERAAGQVTALAAVLLGFTAAAAGLAGMDGGWSLGWSVLATVLPAASTALAAYGTLFAFEQQSKIYGDAVRAARAALRSVEEEARITPSLTADQRATETVRRVEAAFRQEHAQWGQLTSQIEIRDDTRL